MFKNKIKPKFSLQLIPKLNLYLGLFVLLFGSFIFSFFFQGLVSLFYSTSITSEFILPESYLIDVFDLKIISWCFSLLGISLASLFAYKIWLSSFIISKNYKNKSAYLTHSQSDLLWYSFSFIFRVITLLMFLTLPILLNVVGENFLLFFVLNFLVLTLKENNHLKQVYKLNWKYDFLKLIAYFTLSIIITFCSFPYLNSLNEKLEQKTLKSQFGIILPVSLNFKREFYDCPKYYLNKLNNELFLANEQNNVPLDSFPFIHKIEKFYKYCGNEIYYIDALMPMHQVEELMKINSLMGYSILQYAVKRTDEIIHYNDLYSQLNYVVGYNLIENNTLKYAEIYYKYRPNILVEAPPPPPPPFEQSYPINFDNNTIGEQNFKHLHLSKNKEYLWNGNVIQNEELYEKIFPLMGSDTILYISYDANVSFGSLTAIIDYIDEIKKNRLDSFIEKNDINLSSLEYYNISEYKRIQNQFRLRKKVLTAFYSKDYFKWE